MKILVSINTCNTDNFGLYIPKTKDVNHVKSFCLLAQAYPKKNGFTKRTYILECDCDKVCCIVKRNGGEKGIYQKIEISPTITTDYAHQTNSYGLPHVIEFDME